MHIQLYIPTIALRFLKWSILPAFAIALMLAWGTGGGGESVIAQEDAGPRGANGEGGIASHAAAPDLNIVVVPDADGSGCDTLAASNSLECRIEPGASFTVATYVDSYAGLDNAWYTGVSIGVHYSPGLTLKDRPGDTEWGPVNARFWAGCTTPALIVTDEPGQYGTSCGSGAHSTQTNQKLLELDFTCPAEKSTQTITLVHGRDQPIFLEGALYGVQHAYDTRLISNPTSTSSPLLPDHEESRADTLVIHCDNYYPWDVHGPGQSADLDGIVDLPNDILGVILHFCPNALQPCSKANLP